MNLVVGLKVGIREIFAHKFRSFLTMLGIILGVSSLIAMFAIAAGMANGMRETLTAVGGIERVEIVTKDVSEELVPIAEISPGRTMADVDALRAAAPLISEISPESRLGGAAITKGPVTVRSSVTGAAPDYIITENHIIDYGRWLTPLDLERNLHVAVIGSALWKEIAPGSKPKDAIGAQVLVNQRPFTIVGIFIEYVRQRDERRKELGIGQKGRSGDRGGRDPFQWKNRNLIIPITTMMTEFKSAQLDAQGVDQGPVTELDQIAVRVADPARFDEALEQIGNVLRGTHRGIDDFGYNTREDWFDRIETGVKSARISGSLIAGISLLVGGIGITNIMLASITERIREIGVRRAIGATPLDIFTQIIVESVVIGLLGGILGVAFSLVLLKAITSLAPSENIPDLQASSVVISFMFSVLVGILSGLYPAWKASTLDPIQALRYE